MSTITVIIDPLELPKNDEISDTYMNICYLDTKLETIKDKVYSGSLFAENSFTNVAFENCVFFACHFDSNLFSQCTFLNCEFHFTHLLGNVFENCQFDAVTWISGSQVKNDFKQCLTLQDLVIVPRALLAA